MENQPKPIRDLMPARFTRIILERVGSGSASNVSEAVALEKTTSKFWKYIIDLAMETDSKACRARLKFIEQKQEHSNAA